MQHFGKKSADKFLNETFSLIKHASYYPGLGKLYRDNIRYLVVNRKTIVFYRHDKKNNVRHRCISSQRKLAK